MTDDFSLTVYYDADDVDIGERDAAAVEAAGRDFVGSGTYLPTMTRDLEFRFASESERDAAKDRLRDAGFRFVP